MIPLFFNIGTNLILKDYDLDNKIPKIQGFSKNDYNEILEQEEHGLGNITITNITFDAGFGKGFDAHDKYYTLLDDIGTGLNITHKEIIFLNTTSIAIVDNLNENITERREITVRLNETLSVQYNTSIGDVEGFLIYSPLLFNCRLMELWEKVNGTSDVNKVNEVDYSMDNDINFLKFEYDDYFGTEFKNFSMYLIWEYDLTIDSWELYQYPDSELSLLIINQEQTIYPKYNYHFDLNGMRFNTSTSEIIGAHELKVKLKINLPDMELVWNHELTFNGVLVGDINDYINPDGSMNVGDYFTANNTRFNLDFQCNFTVRFYNAVDKTWAIDRLIRGNNVRERIYFPTIVSGPTSIYLKYITIFESTISIDQVISNTTLFERNLPYFDANVSLLEEDIRDSIIFTENATKKKGLEIKLPYLIKGEICPCIFEYTTTRNLKIKITDNIYMPIANLEVKIYYYGIIFGTYISNEKTQPISPTITNENGEILVKNVPNGNYTIKIFQNNELLMETSVSSYIDINYVVTNIPHFPLLILIFGIFSCIPFFIGLIYYNKYKNKRF